MTDESRLGTIGKYGMIFMVCLLVFISIPFIPVVDTSKNVVSVEVVTAEEIPVGSTVVNYEDLPADDKNTFRQATGQVRAEGSMSSDVDYVFLDEEYNEIDEYVYEGVSEGVQKGLLYIVVGYVTVGCATKIWRETRDESRKNLVIAFILLAVCVNTYSLAFMIPAPVVIDSPVNNADSDARVLSVTQLPDSERNEFKSMTGETPTSSWNGLNSAREFDFLRSDGEFYPVSVGWPLLDAFMLVYVCLMLLGVQLFLAFMMILSSE